MVESLTGSLLVASTLVDDPLFAGGVCLIVYHDENDVIGVMLNRPLRPGTKEMVSMLQQGSGQLDLNSDDLLDADDGADQWGDQDENQWLDESHIDSVEDLPFEDGSSDEAQERLPLDPEVLEAAIVAAWDASPLRWMHFGGPLSGPIVAVHQVPQWADAETGQGIFVAAQRKHLEHVIQEPQQGFRLIVGHSGWKTAQLLHEIDSGMWHLIPATADAVFSPPGDMWHRLVRRAASRSLAHWLGIPDVPKASELN